MEALVVVVADESADPAWYDGFWRATLSIRLAAMKVKSSLLMIVIAGSFEHGTDSYQDEEQLIEHHS